MKKNFIKACVILIFVTIVSIFLTGCKSKQLNDLDQIIERDKIIFGVKNDSKPFGFLENGELKGIDIDIARYITKSILGDAKKAEFKVVSSSDRLLTLSSGEVDMIIANMSITPQRRMLINFSLPYYIAGQTVLVSKDSNIKSITDLQNKRVVVVFGSTAEKNLRMVVPNATIVGTKSYITAFEMLKSKQVEGMASDDTLLSAFAENSNYRILNKRYTIEPYAIGVRKSELSETLLEKINTILEEMKRNGTLKAIERKWIK
jgi:putative glutamine transport system substrate-binding protein